MSIERIHDVLVFLRVVENHGMSAAGRILNISPSTVSKLITRLEKRLNTSLINRNSRGFSLTADGVAFYERGLKIIEAIEAAEASVTPVDGPSGALKVQLIPAFMRFQLAPLIPEFLKRYPHIKIDITLSVERTDLVENGIDVAVHVGRPNDSELFMTKVASSRWFVSAAPTYIEKHGAPSTPYELHNHRCLCQPANSPWREWSFLIDNVVQTIPVSPYIVCNQTDSLLEIARAGGGIVRAAEYACADYLTSGLLVPVLKEFVDPNPQPIVALFQHRQNLNRRSRAFIEFLQEKFQSEPWRL